MILTCPECSTTYVVKDGAIPPGGRKVRCAACKHSWHQDAEPGNEADESAAEPLSAEAEEAPVAENVEPQNVSTIDPPEVSDDWQPVETGPSWDEPEPVVAAPPVVDERSEPAMADDDDFAPFTYEEEEELPRRRWPRLLLLFLVVAVAAVAFWFLAPASLRDRLGLADKDGTPLQVMGLSQDRQQLASGNDLFTVSGRIVNPTEASQKVPPLQAELLADNKQTVLYSWTIAPPAETLPPNDSRMFHSAEMGVPPGGKYLRLRLRSAKD